MRVGRPLNRLRRVFGQGRLIGFVLLVDLLILRAWDPDPLVAMRFKFFDMFQQWLPRVETEFPVTIVDVDEASLAELGQWPWPRAVLASLVNRLRQDGAAAIGFDVVFAEPDRNLSIDTARLLALPPADLRRALIDLQTNDAIFARSLGQGRVVLGQIALTAADRPPASPRDPQTTAAEIGGDPRPHLNQLSSLIENIPDLAAAAAGRGNFGLVPEVDGIVRRVPLAVAVGDVIVPSLDVELLRVATGQQSYAIQLEPAVGGTTSGIAAVIVAGVAIRTDGKGMIHVRYGPHEPARFVSAADVVAGRADPRRFAGRIVLVGTSAAGLRDIRATPLDANMPGVEVHAQLLENVLAGTYLVRPNYALGAELIILLLGGLLIIAFVPMLPAGWTLGLHGLASAGLFGGALYLFAAESLLFDWFYPVASGTLVYAWMIYAKYALTERQRKQVSAAFGQYLSPVLVERLAREPDRLRLGGELKTMTVMFADLRNFTAISEQMREDPQALTSLVNRFLTPMTEAVLRQDGTIDKYVGDSLIAFWNAPLDMADHAARACTAALAMGAALDRLNDALRAEAQAAGRVPLSLAMGIGVNTGECVVGNLGSLHRFNYSVLGDPVNLASRLESLTKYYGLGILVSESTKQLAPGFAMVEADLVAVFGKAEPVRIYALLGGADLAESEGFRRLADRHARMITAYRRQEWDVARAMLAQCHGLDGRLDRLHRLYEARIAEFEADPPGPDWDAVFRPETK
jgi:adenylate cyclase